MLSLFLIPSWALAIDPFLEPTTNKSHGAPAKQRAHKLHYKHVTHMSSIARYAAQEGTDSKDNILDIQYLHNTNTNGNRAHQFTLVKPFAIYIAQYIYIYIRYLYIFSCSTRSHRR